MRRFARLFTEIDHTTRISERVAALERYFREAEPASAAWALWILSGRKLKRLVTHTQLRQWAAEAAELPGWLVDECYDAVGDLSETLSLILPGGDGPGTDRPLSEIIEHGLMRLPTADDPAAVLRGLWQECNRTQRFLLHKLISGNFRMGVAAATVAGALAEVAGVSKPVMTHRLMGSWSPTAEDFRRLIAADGGAADPAQPYPFYLASPIEQPPAELGDPGDWLAEYKWDGIRAQMIHRPEAVLLWSRGEEVINEAFPELVQAARRLPAGTVLDGEVLAWEGERPLPFARLQTRLNRKRVEATFWPETPVVFMAFDVLEAEGQDRRKMPQAWRRRLLERLVAGSGARSRDTSPASATVESPADSADQSSADSAGQSSADSAGQSPANGIASEFRVSPLLPFATWDELAALRRGASTEHGAEGVMLKRRESAYQVGRVRGDWWKWKVDPFTIDAVLIYAQRGSGRRASLFTDYTFGVWNGGELTPIAKAYSGLTDEEIAEVDAFVRRHTLEGRGGFRVVEPTLVFELAFEGLQRSSRHKSGIALRFPRMNRWRRDKRAEEADTLATVEALLRG